MIKVRNAITGDSMHLYDQLRYSMGRADKIDIIISFLMESGVKLLLNDLKSAKNRGAKIRILTGNYLHITQPSALYLLRQELGMNMDLRFYSEAHQSFHPKAYLFHYWEGAEECNEIYIGSSNVSYSALTSAIEWNYRFDQHDNPEAFHEFRNAFELLFTKRSRPVTDEVLKTYSKQWHKPNVMKDLDLYEREAENYREDKPEPRGAQIEALYYLHKTRQEGFEKALVVLPTGTGKTLLAAFDSKKSKRILFIAHREEILQQAKEAFRWVHGNEKTYGDFSSNHKDTSVDILFAQVQTLGQETYLQPAWFCVDAFDYIIIDEFHHAVASSYRRILNYFHPEFFLGMTATPERLDKQDIYILCDYNIVYEVHLQEAINKGWLVPFRYYGIYDDTVDYDQVGWKNGKYDENELEKNFIIYKRLELILRHYRKYPSKRALGFCVSTKHADVMAAYFCQNGVKAAAVYSKPGSMRREEAVQKLESGELQVLFSIDMFNEGLDIKSVDMVLFLRPTQSPIIFLQQLGRGLRLQKEKQYLVVLDFIGNYRKAYTLPLLLSGKTALCSDVSSQTAVLQQAEFPDNCLVDFDLELIDLFQRQREQELGITERMKRVFYTIMEELGHVPSRTELYHNLHGEDLEIMIKQKKHSPFKHYLAFLNMLHLLTTEEEALYQGSGGAFIHMIETTSMSRTYKMPLLLAFCGKDEIFSCVTDDLIYESFSQYYHIGNHRVDLLQDKSKKMLDQWTVKDYVDLAKRNPVRYLLQSHSDWFVQKEACTLALTEKLQPWLRKPEFVMHVKDAIDYRTIDYYRKRFRDEMYI